MPYKEESTEEKLSQLSSLLQPATYSQAQYLEALISSDGDVEAAAEKLLLSPSSSGSKRKAGAGGGGAGGNGLLGWLGADRDGKQRKKKVKVDHDAKKATQVKDEISLISDDEDDEIEVLDVKRPKRPSPKPQLPSIDLMSKLKQASSVTPAKQHTPPRPPIVCLTQAHLDQHLPSVTLHDHPFTPSFASALFLFMMKEAESWKKYHWFLNGKQVESGHSGSFYRKRDGEQEMSKEPVYWYAGKPEPESPHPFPPMLQKAIDIIQPFVNQVIKDRPYRFSQEYAGEWEVNVVASNHYEGASSSVGWHSDQMSYLGPYSQIASLSLGVTRNFRLRPVDAFDTTSASAPSQHRTYEIPLHHNSLVIMHGGTQERYKHTVPPMGKNEGMDLFRPGWDADETPIALEDRKAYKSRINITFRFYRPDYNPLKGVNPVTGQEREGQPICQCGIPTVLRADQKGKARARLSVPRPTASAKLEPGQSEDGQVILEDDMIFFYQCQASTRDLPGCGYFRILDWRKEGRGPCIGGV